MKISGMKKYGRQPFVARSRAFTLVEILIVVIILGFLAAIIIPKFSNAVLESKESMLKENLRMMRVQIGTYRAQHWDTSPGYDGGGNLSEQAFLDQMTKFSDEKGNTNDVASEEFPYGPYLRTMPENPIDSSAAINIIADNQDMPANAPGIDGWIFKPGDIVFRANTPGNDESGSEYYSY